MESSVWEKLARPPASALKAIQAGRLKGKSDINPMWRIKAMTEVFGQCGDGWKFEIVRLWTEAGSDGQVFAFAHVNLFVRTSQFIEDKKWNDPIPGIGGHYLIVKESSGLHANDEGYKMAITDALGTAMKMLGVAADVYMGLWDGSKYKDETATKKEEKKVEAPIADPFAAILSGAPVPTIDQANVDGQIKAMTRKIWAKAREANITQEQIKEYSTITLSKPSSKEWTVEDCEAVLSWIEYKRGN
jgi:hypothetical protein